MTLSKEFLLAWGDAASKRSEALQKNWHNYKKYTSIILNTENCLLDDVAIKMKLYSYPRNYYSVDGILYTEKDIVPEKKENEYWFRSISVAFEHEHVFDKDLFKEIAHLLILRSELSVIVTYPPRGVQPLMEYFHSIINDCSHAGELDLKRNFLFIFGYTDPLEWEGLVYTKTGWQKI